MLLWIVIVNGVFQRAFWETFPLEKRIKIHQLEVCILQNSKVHPYISYSNTKNNWYSVGGVEAI